MRIMVLSPGQSVHTARYITGLVRAGHEVVLVDPTDLHDPPQGAYAFRPYPRVAWLERWGLRQANRLARHVKALALRRLCRRLKPDVVHVHWVDARALQCVMAGLHPLVLTCWGSDINNLFDSQPDDGGEYRTLIQSTLRRADHITADSVEVLSRCDVLDGGSVPKSLLYLGIDLEVFTPGHQESGSLREQLGIPAETKVIFSPRALRPSMGHQHVIEAFARVRDSTALPPAVLLLKRYLPYGDGYEARLVELIASLRLQDKVIWLDASINSAMPAEYALADVVVNYPERDAMPVTFFEAAACRRPIISSRLEAYLTVFDDSSITFLPPADPLSLAAAIRGALLEPSEVRNQRLDTAFSLVKKYGDQRECVCQYEELYRRLAGGRSECGSPDPALWHGQDSRKTWHGKTTPDGTP
jgi:glycosyltransferase involved in cell wall biosynthesis